MKEMYIIIGIPGSGKSTVAGTLGARVHSSDAIRGELYGDESVQTNPQKVFDLLYQRTKEDLSAGRSVVVDATSLYASIRHDIVEMHREYADRFIAVFVDVDPDTAKERNRNRERFVPEEVIDRMYRSLTPPSFEEGFDEIRIVDKDGKVVSVASRD